MPTYTYSYKVGSGSEPDPGEKFPDHHHWILAFIFFHQTFFHKLFFRYGK